mmetsp:Transcript_13041/g.39419  ORF Transcript_13041/g.39419 Transcript_13041/m.39419 type:complete len:640 (-) Transcript_13041:997-2916(-)
MQADERVDAAGRADDALVDVAEATGERAGADAELVDEEQEPVAVDEFDGEPEDDLDEHVRRQMVVPDVRELVREEPPVLPARVVALREVRREEVVQTLRPDRRLRRRDAAGLALRVVQKGSALGDRQREHAVRQVEFLVAHVHHDQIPRHVHEERAFHEPLHFGARLRHVAVVRPVAVLENVPRARRRSRSIPQIRTDRPHHLGAAVLALRERRRRVAHLAERSLDGVRAVVRVQNFHDDAAPQRLPPLLLGVAGVVRDESDGGDASSGALDGVVHALPTLSMRARRRPSSIPGRRHHRRVVVRRGRDLEAAGSRRLAAPEAQREAVASLDGVHGRATLLVAQRALGRATVPRRDQDALRQLVRNRRRLGGQVERRRRRPLGFVVAVLHAVLDVERGRDDVVRHAAVHGRHRHVDADDVCEVDADDLGAEDRLESDAGTVSQQAERHGLGSRCPEARVALPGSSVDFDAEARAQHAHHFAEAPPLLARQRAPGLAEHDGRVAPDFVVVVFVLFFLASTLRRWRARVVVADEEAAFQGEELRVRQREGDGAAARGRGVGDGGVGGDAEGHERVRAGRAVVQQSDDVQSAGAAVLGRAARHHQSVVGLVELEAPATRDDVAFVEVVAPEARDQRRRSTAPQ